MGRVPKMSKDRDYQGDWNGVGEKSIGKWMGKGDDVVDLCVICLA